MSTGIDQEDNINRTRQKVHFIFLQFVKFILSQFQMKLTVLHFNKFTYLTNSFSMVWFVRNFVDIW